MARLLAFTLTAALLGTVSCSTTSTPAAADATTRLYDVRDLVFPPQPGAKALIELDRLAVCLQTTTTSEPWDRADREMQTEPQGYLIVKASPGLHDKVATMLTDMRRFASKQ